MRARLKLMIIFIKGAFTYLVELYGAILCFYVVLFFAILKQILFYFCCLQKRCSAVLL